MENRDGRGISRFAVASKVVGSEVPKQDGHPEPSPVQRPTNGT